VVPENKGAPSALVWIGHEKLAEILGMIDIYMYIYIYSSSTTSLSGTSQLLQLCLFVAVPFFGFGFADNATLVMQRVSE